MRAFLVQEFAIFFECFHGAFHAWRAGSWEIVSQCDQISWFRAKESLFGTSSYAENWISRNLSKVSICFFAESQSHSFHPTRKNCSFIKHAKKISRPHYFINIFILLFHNDNIDFKTTLFFVRMVFFLLFCSTWPGRKLEFVAQQGDGLTFFGELFQVGKFPPRATVLML